MKKIYGIKSLVEYLDSVNFPMSESKINDLILKKEIPHQKPLSTMLVFNLEHIDWWIEEQRLKP
ncbi:hypothetical protein AM499_08860 [Bacillus sp. FJAT-22090]|uniref:hypothetical protein n=1 Tax=Bacillus sp. FJAT-22090 TaxID=1581038 RepID=UPI0006AECC43|nr:hypothetical protein [Bacillus sp. FJAT-22090]ALC85925.1 hypothetical protein AM499_08860 [Bacillus sp. FJAT-22090]